jgi:peptidoglycan-associated lipoprotein
MKFVTRAVLIGSILFVASCGNNRFDNEEVVDLNASSGSLSGSLGDAGDPNSPAYFQQAIGDRVFFAVDQSTLGDEAKSVLAAQAEWLARNADYTAIIEGHADEQGTREYNVALGARRAASVRDYLVSRGVPADRMRTISYGKERPVEVCSEEACYSKNRRAVTVISVGLSG